MSGQRQGSYARRLAAFTAAVAAAFTPAACAAAAAPPVRHVFVVVLENQDYASTFGANSDAPYLAHDLTASGQLLTHYYGIGHASLGNYIAMVSGQAPDAQTQGDCQVFSPFAGLPGPDADGQAVGQGCVYPGWVDTVAGQLTAKGLSWKGYMEDMGTPCRHPAIGARDDAQQARTGDQYATRHNPFVYFHSIIDSPGCESHDVPLQRLPDDLASADTTANLSFITPNLCDDGHDAPCVDGRPGGLVSADAWLKTWIPRITSSPAFAKDGLLVVTFDEAENDASACCGEPPGNGGGRVGAVVISPFTRAGTVNSTPYNHYALLRTIEDLFGLEHLGYAGRAGLRPFGEDVFAARQRQGRFHVLASSRGCVGRRPGA
jgi:hypothetical protein